MSACSWHAVSHMGCRLMVASSAKISRPRCPGSPLGVSPPTLARKESISGGVDEGLFAIVRALRGRAWHVLASIFVNPMQFAPHEDLANYPPHFDADVTALRERGVDLVWAPSVSLMYPPHFATRLVPEGSAAVGLEDKFRPHFFTGVATVVGKLLIQCMPDFAMFGEKDYQQLRVVTRLVEDLDLPVKIVAVPTVRESDGLALSSRNAYLSADERKIAPTLQ